MGYLTFLAVKCDTAALVSLPCCCTRISQTYDLCSETLLDRLCCSEDTARNTLQWIEPAVDGALRCGAYLRIALAPSPAEDLLSRKIIFAERCCMHRQRRAANWLPRFYRRIIPCFQSMRYLERRRQNAPGQMSCCLY